MTSSMTTSGSTAIPTTNPRPHKMIKHSTIIDAPIETVWKDIVDTSYWSWNRWTRLETDSAPTEGLQGKLKACYDGNDQDWQSFDFEFAQVDPRRHVLAWQGKVLGGLLFKGYHTMQLEAIDAKQCKLIHTEVFGGLLPMLRLGLPYPKLDRNYRLMNESLKRHVEQQ